MRAREFLFVAFLGVGVLMPLSIAAQESNAESTLRDGAWALQFRILDNFQLSWFQGTMLSVKHHHSDQSALRLGVSASFDNTDRAETTDEGLPSSGDINRHFVAIDLQYLQYTRPARWASAFFGAGPTFVWRKHESDFGNEMERNTDLFKEWLAGLTGTFGVEMFPIDNVGLHAEYGVTLSYETRETEFEEDESDRARSRDLDFWRLRGEDVRFGVSVYF